MSENSLSRKSNLQACKFSPRYWKISASRNTEPMKEIIVLKALAIVPFWDYGSFMRIIALSTLKSFWANPAHTDVKEPLLSWYRFALSADWASPADIKSDLKNASILRDGRVVFNIAGNKYRLVVWINYPYRVVSVRFIGTHTRYDTINPQTI